MELEAIKANLDVVRRRVRLYYLVHGLGRVCLILAGFVLFTYLADYLIPKLPVGVRFAFLLGGAGVLGWTVWRHLAYPMGKAIGDDDIALCVESANPKLRDRLISALQLSRSLGRPGEEQFNSPDLVKVLVEDTKSAVKGIRFLDILTSRIPVGVLVRGSCAVAAIAAYFIFVTPGHASIWAQRDLLLRNVPWDRASHIRFVFDKATWDPVDKAYHVPKGEHFNAQVEATGAAALAPSDDTNVLVRGLFSVLNFISGRGRRPQVHLAVKYDSGAEERVRMSQDPGRAYHYEFASVRESFRMRASTEDADTEEVVVRALTPPRIDRISVRYAYPSYTGLHDTPADRPEEGGNLKAPVGTRARIEADVNVRCSHAQLQLQQGKEVIPIDLATTPRAGGEGCTIGGELTIVTDGEYLIDLQSEEGLHAGNLRYGVHAVVDNPPVVKVVEPAMDKTVTPNASVQLLVLTTDDYGITEVSFHWQRVGAEAPTKLVFDHQQNNADYGATKIESKHTIELSSFGAKEGDVIRYHIEAADNHDPDRLVTKSKEYNLSVVSKTTKEAQVEEAIGRLKEELRKDADIQEAEEGRVKSVIEPFSAKDQIGLPEKRQMGSLTTEQRQLGQRVERLTREFEEVLKDIDVNKLMDPTSRERIENVKGLVGDVAHEKSPKAAEELSRAETSPRGTERGERLTAATERQQEARDEMMKALEELGKWEDYQEVVKVVREILQQQQNLKGQIKNK